MRLKSGLVIDEPRALIRGFVREWYPMYDGVTVATDNQLRIVEIALSTMLNSRISGNPAGEIWLKRDAVEAALTRISSDTDLLSVGLGQPIPGISGIMEAVDAMCAIRRVKLSVPTKILHKKRPSLIPIFDSEVEGQYQTLTRSGSGLSWGDTAQNSSGLSKKTCSLWMVNYASSAMN